MTGLVSGQSARRDPNAVVRLSPKQDIGLQPMAIEAG